MPQELKTDAQNLGTYATTFEEWYAKEIEIGAVSEDSFTKVIKKIILHGHCHQKALVGIEASKKVLSFPKNYQVTTINSGCCGMAGSFGYEKEHYDLSMQVGELVLFPSIRAEDENVLIAASGTSCRHQIKDGTGRHSQHAIEILYDALENNEFVMTG